MSGCENWQNTIEPYLDGELDTQPLAQFEAHLPACSACRDALEAKRWLADQLSALPKPAASPRFEARFWARLAREEDAQADNWFAHLLRTLRAQWAVPAGVVAVLGLWFSLNGTPQELSQIPKASEWEMITAAEELELFESEELELLALLDVLEDWDGSEEI